MKHSLLSLTIVLFFSTIASAQTPAAFNYQAVVRDASGQVLTDRQVGFRASLLGADTVYVETHEATTNAFGLVNLKIGRGTAISGEFADIDWSEALFIEVGLDVTGGTNYRVMGAAELLSVPYALYAANADGGEDGDTDAGNELQVLTKTGTDISLSQNGGTVSINDGDADPQNEIELPTDAAEGAVVYYDGTSWVAVEAGRGGQTLTLSNDGVPVWAGPSTEELDEVRLSNGEIVYFHPTDNFTGVNWRPASIDSRPVTPGNSTINAVLNDFTGEENTRELLEFYAAAAETEEFAAKRCDELVAFGFSDWYLPAYGELAGLYNTLGPQGTGELTSGQYMSSSTENGGLILVLDFSSGNFLLEIRQFSGPCRCARK